MNNGMNPDGCKEYVIGSVRCQVSQDADQAAVLVAQRIAQIIREKSEAGEPAVLGLATGSTPVPVYQELIRMHREEGLSFQNVHSFNLDEYYGLKKDHPESYQSYMQAQLFSHVDIPQDQAHVPDGMIARENVEESCRKYEEAIEACGGLDFQLLGIGRTGHIGFNEPGSQANSRTRLITLDPVTRIDAARDFVGLENVPRAAITMGVGTILNAREIYLLAWGRGKASVIRKALEESPTEDLPASLLQGHQKIIFALNAMAASELTCVRSPWTNGQVTWSEAMIKRAVHGLSHKVGKPILKLVDRDYQLNGLEELLSLYGSAYELNILVFKRTQATITGWPGGKPAADDRSRPVPSDPTEKRIVILASEPGVECSPLGGTLNRLQKQGHQVSIVYLTSGGLTVSGDAVNRLQNLLAMIAESGGVLQSSENLSSGLLELVKKISDEATTEQAIRSLIRKHHSALAMSALNLSESTHHLSLPFYESGGYRNFAPSDQDREVFLTLLNKLQPHQIYVSGKMSDPSSLEGVCWQLFEDTMSDWGEWKNTNQIWLFREGGDRWESHEVDMAVPVSPDERALKEVAMAKYPVEIFLDKMDGALRVANDYDDLGLPEYEEIEAFQLHKPSITA